MSGLAKMSVQGPDHLADDRGVMEVTTSTRATMAKANGSALVLAQASDQVTIDSSRLTAIWLLLAVLGVVLAWALFELRRRRKMALRLDRLGGLTATPRYPSANTHSKEDFEALLDYVAMDDRLDLMVEKAESASHEVTDVVEAEVDEDATP